MWVPVVLAAGLVLSACATPLSSSTPTRSTTTSPASIRGAALCRSIRQLTTLIVARDATDSGRDFLFPAVVDVHPAEVSQGCLPLPGRVRRGLRALLQSRRTRDLAAAAPGVRHEGDARPDRVRAALRNRRDAVAGNASWLLSRPRRRDGPARRLAGHVRRLHAVRRPLTAFAFAPCSATCACGGRAATRLACACGPCGRTRKCGAPRSGSDGSASTSW